MSSVNETGADEAAGDNADFGPTVEVKEIEVKTGEEEEIVCLKMRSKLFIFVKEDIYGGEVRKNWWRERGTGDIKILRHKTEGLVRVLMRQEKTLKICLNHLVSPHVLMQSNVGSDRSWVFTAADFADGELKTDTFAIKFGSAENANKFKDAIEIAKKINEKKAEPSELKPWDDEADGSAAPPKPPSASEKEKAALDAEIEKRNKREEIRRDSVRAISAQADSDHDSQTEDVNEAVEGLAKIGLGGKALCGGYSETSVDDEEVKAAAAFAAKELGKEFVKIAEAARQVVAGTNFRVVIHVKHEDGAVHAYLATVFKSLPHAGSELKLSDSTHQGPV